MSTPSRFKKDKEIIAEYESQVKGKWMSVGMGVGGEIFPLSFLLPDTDPNLGFL